MKALDHDLEDIEASNERFRAEAQRFGLRFRCEHCAHVAGQPSEPECSMSYPNHFLKGTHVAIMPKTGALAFCKYFELGEEPKDLEV